MAFVVGRDPEGKAQCRLVLSFSLGCRFSFFVLILLQKGGLERDVGSTVGDTNTP